jgi:hypothetical protein
VGDEFGHGGAGQAAFGQQPAVAVFVVVAQPEPPLASRCELDGRLPRDGGGDRPVTGQHATVVVEAGQGGQAHGEGDRALPLSGLGVAGGCRVGPAQQVQGDVGT